MPEPPMDHFLEARAIHRVVRALHDGECPRCHKVSTPEEVTDSANGDDTCPHCQFTISRKTQETAYALFAPLMEHNLQIFENWRKDVPNTPD